MLSFVYRYKFERCSSCLRSQHGVNVACIVAAVLGSVRGVDLVVDGEVGFRHEGDVLVDAASLDVTCMARLRGAEPGAAEAAFGDAPQPWYCSSLTFSSQSTALPWRCL